MNASMPLHHHEMMTSVMTNLEPIRFDAPGAVPAMEVVADWKSGLPIFKSSRMMVRELVKSDAATLLALLKTEEVARFVSPPPTTPEGFEKFIQWAIGQRQAGNQMTFGMVPEGFDHAVGLVQVRAIAPNFSVAEWGFAVGSPFWGTGLFLASARTTLDFAFQHTGVNRLEARAAVQNGRGNGALRKLGAVQEGILRGSLLKDGKYLDQIMWSIVASDWYQSNALSNSTVH
jgi:[ribosomal protein S5]-alanine N-acetyltransferase